MDTFNGVAFGLLVAGLTWDAVGERLSGLVHDAHLELASFMGRLALWTGGLASLAALSIDLGVGATLVLLGLVGALSVVGWIIVLGTRSRRA